jgi:hypothetical protein
MTSTEPTTFARILSKLSDPSAIVDNVRHDHSPYHLASLANCGSPDSVDSPGAAFLSSVARDVADRVNDDPAVAREDIADLIEDGAHEIADSAVPVYTHQRWQTFVDLQAYQEDTSEYGAIDDLTNAAGVALYMVANRLVLALAEELTGALDEDTDEDA